MQKSILVCGAGGFIGGHLVSSLKTQGHHVIGVDIKLHEFCESDADLFLQLDLRDQANVRRIFNEHDIQTVYQLAADMGGAGYIFTGENDADIMHNSSLINLNIAEAMVKHGVKSVFYTSSACMYPSHNQEDPDNPVLNEQSAYPANPDSEYGWEKLFSERMWMAFGRNHALRVRIARLHNVFGPLGAWNNGKEKAPAALCRKICQNQDEIEIWGNGQQTRSFLYIDQCIEGIHRLQSSDYNGPVNLGSSRKISINELAIMIANHAGKQIKLKHVPGPTGVAGRTSDNALIKKVLDWEPKDALEVGLAKTYDWIVQQSVKNGKKDKKSLDSRDI